jgi:glycosyltransferase involved in cell wall biosynthesis
MPAISVIIPTYNCGRFLAESLDSVFAQTFRDFEVIVVDDGSTDDTSSVLAGYAGRLTVVAGGHGGLSSARNLGLARATGDWVAFHDADDVALPDRFTFATHYLATHPEYDTIFCNGERMAPGTGRLVPAEFFHRSTTRALDAEDLFLGYPVYFQGSLVPRRAFVAAGSFDATLRVQPDIEYGYRLLAHCRAAIVDRVVFRYRWHTTNNSGDRLGGREDIARILTNLETIAPAAASQIGTRRLRARLALHYYRIARQRMDRGELSEARMALGRAADLQPLHPRYQLLRLWHGR